jgi:hypothetical protein
MYPYIFNNLRITHKNRGANFSPSAMESIIQFFSQKKRVAQTLLNHSNRISIKKRNPNKELRQWIP